MATRPDEDARWYQGRVLVACSCPECDCARPVRYDQDDICTRCLSGDHRAERLQVPRVPL